MVFRIPAGRAPSLVRVMLRPVDLIDLAQERLSGTVLFANDEFFAAKENLLLERPPEFRENEYTVQGKWMDGWETRRRRSPGHDTCIVRLGLPGVLERAVVDTSFFRGNFPESCSLEGLEAAPETRVEELLARTWKELVPRSPLEGHKENVFDTRSAGRITHVRFHIHPDGGVARLRLLGRPVPCFKTLKGRSEVDVAALENGGDVVLCSDMFFGSRHNLIFPGAPRVMGEGWETKRRRGEGHDWAIVRFGLPATVHRIELDTTHFRGNAPDRCLIEACQFEGEDVLSAPFSALLPEKKLLFHTKHVFEEGFLAEGPLSHLRLNIYPDGGVARLRVFGKPT